MAYSFLLAVRYLRSKRGAGVSIGTVLGTLGVSIGVAFLAIVMSVTGGFKDQFREKVLGVNAHVLVLKYSADFREYRDVMKAVESIPGVIGVAPFIINPMMVTKGARTATGVLLKGVDPSLMPKVLDLPKHIVSGSLEGLKKTGATPSEKMDLSEKEQPVEMEEAGPINDLKLEQIPDSGSHSLFEEMKKSIEEEEEKTKKKESGKKSKSPSLSAGEDKVLSPLSPLQGDVTPRGGFRSELPGDDLLPSWLEEDPCKNSELVAKLPGLIVGKTLQKQLRLELGDCVQITSPTVGLSFSARGSRPPIAKPFRVVAVFEAGFDQYDAKLVYTDLYEAELFYGQGDNVTGVEMKVEDIEKASSISNLVKEKLHNGIYRTMDWMDLNRGLFTSMFIQQMVISLVTTLLVVVASFTIVATLVLLVLEKRKEIALLKALGAKDGEIMRLFVYQGGAMGAVGTSLGLILGYLGCRALMLYEFPLDAKVYFISKLPVNLRPAEFFITGGVAFVICVLAAIVPAIFAARTKPSAGLRAE